MLWRSLVFCVKSNLCVLWGKADFFDFLFGEYLRIWLWLWPLRGEVEVDWMGGGERFVRG